MSRAAQEQGVTAPDVYTSFVLPGLLEFVSKPPKKTILDLGPALGENVRWMQGSKLFISNFFEALTETGAVMRPDAKAFAASCDRLLQFPPDVRFDLVLAWDLFNYLSLQNVEALAKRLVAVSQPGTRVMALVSIQKRIPDRPFRFVIRDKDSLRYDVVSAALRDCPRHNEPDLLKRLTGFKVERGMLLRNGMREYSLVREEVAVAGNGAVQSAAVNELARASDRPRYTSIS
jgi:hypothetical protein